jgi:hypothetical protein
MARTPGAKNKSEREHKNDAALSIQKAKTAREREKRKAAEADAKAARKAAKNRG